jgi:hypothetical protein
MGFDPCNRPLKIRESIWDSNTQNENSLGSARVHALTLFCIPRNTRCESWVSFLAITLQTLALVTNPRLGLRHTMLVHDFLIFREQFFHHITRQ